MIILREIRKCNLIYTVYQFNKNFFHFIVLVHGPYKLSSGKLFFHNNTLKSFNRSVFQCLQRASECPVRCKTFKKQRKLFSSKCNKRIYFLEETRSNQFKVLLQLCIVPDVKVKSLFTNHPIKFLASPTAKKANLAVTFTCLIFFWRNKSLQLVFFVGDGT